MAVAEHDDDVAPVAGDLPLRGELLSAERLEATARRLGRSQQWRGEGGPKTTPLLGVASRAHGSLREFYSAMSAEVRGQKPISVASEWLLDNFFLIEEQVRAIKDDLPADYGMELPHLVSGPLREYPRIY